MRACSAAWLLHHRREAAAAAAAAAVDAAPTVLGQPPQPLQQQQKQQQQKTATPEATCRAPLTLVLVQAPRGCLGGHLSLTHIRTGSCCRCEHD